MNTIYKAALTGTVCILAAALPLQAQVPAKTAEKALQGLAKETAALPPAVQGLAKETTAGVTASQAAAQAAARPLLSPSVRKIHAAKTQTLIQNRLLQKQNRQRADWISGVLLYKNEILRGYHLPADYLDGFFLRRIQPYQSRPDYTADNDSDQFLYRGMLLTPEELANIMRVGFSPKDAKWNSGTDGRSAISLSSSSTEASHYIFQNGSKKEGIGVIFKIRRKPTMELGKDPVLNKTQTIYYSYQDIAPADIATVYLWGEYGFESLPSILKKAQEGTLRSNSWTNQFNSIFR